MVGTDEDRKNIRSFTIWDIPEISQPRQSIRVQQMEGTNAEVQYSRTEYEEEDRSKMDETEEIRRELPFDEDHDTMFLAGERVADPNAATRDHCEDECSGERGLPNDPTVIVKSKTHSAKPKVSEGAADNEDTCCWCLKL